MLAARNNVHLDTLLRAASMVVTHHLDTLLRAASMVVTHHLDTLLRAASMVVTHVRIHCACQ